MNGEFLKQFLVGVGFGVDNQSFKSFMTSVNSATIKVGIMATAIKGAAAASFLAINKVAQDFEEIGYQHRIIAPAINKAILLRQMMADAYKEAGINMREAVQNSLKFNMSLQKVKLQLDAVYKSAASRFLPMLTKNIQEFSRKLSRNMPAILNNIEAAVKFIFKMFGALVDLSMRMWSILTRLFELLKDLDRATNGWSTAIMAVVAAFKILGLSFLATPFGLVLAGLAAVLALYDDYKSWLEGNKSLFDWAPWTKSIKIFNKVLDGAVEGFKMMFNQVRLLFELLKNLFSLNFSAAFGNIKDLAKGVGQMFTKGLSQMGNVWDLASEVANTGFSQAEKTFFAEPLGSNSNSSRNVNINQNVTNNINGANGNSVMDSLQRSTELSNQSLMRDLRGAVR